MVKAILLVYTLIAVALAWASLYLATRPEATGTVTSDGVRRR